LLSAEARAALDGSSPEKVFAPLLDRIETRDPLSRMLYVDTKLWLPDDLLARGDKTSMAASIEARIPLLDHKLVEFAASLPSSVKVRRLTGKFLLKRVGRAWLPERIISRKKQGFPIPLSVWFRKDARSFVRDVLSPTALRRRGLLNPCTVDRLITENESGSANHGPVLWALLSLELWHRLFVDSSRDTRSDSDRTPGPAVAAAYDVVAR
jgi:asparagine synthase (glutamine-hydrolysing)